jgi:hypothetical protein
MPEHYDYSNDDLFNPETHHESSDVPTRALFWAMIIFVGFSIVSFFLVLFLYKAFVKSERKQTEAPMTSVARPANLNVPQNQPLLQPFPKKDAQQVEVSPNRNTPVTDLADMRAAEDAVLHSYGYVDKQKGMVRIPIDQAKDLVIGRLQSAPITPQAEPLVPVPAGQTPAPQQAAPNTSPDTGAIPAPATTPATTTTGGAHP